MVSRDSFPQSNDDLQAIFRQYGGLFLGIAVLLLVGVLLSTMFYRVEATDEAVVLRFGRQHATANPGLNFKAPWPIDKVYHVPVRSIQSLEFGFSTERAGRRTKYSAQSKQQLDVTEMLTGDLNLAHLEWVVQYRIKDAANALFKMGGVGGDSWMTASAEGSLAVNPAVPDTIRDVSESVMRKLVGDISIDSVLTLGREQIAFDAKEAIQEMLDQYEAGVEIVAVKLQTTEPPAAVRDAFQEVNRARQLKEKTVNEAEGQRNRQIPAARGARDKAISESEGYKERIILETKGRINAFLSQLKEYEKSPDVTRTRLYLETLEEVLQSVGEKTIIDESVEGVLPLLNLDTTSGGKR